MKRTHVCGECGHYDDAHRERVGQGFLAKLSAETGPCHYPIRGGSLYVTCKCPAYVELEVRGAA